MFAEVLHLRRNLYLVPYILLAGILIAGYLLWSQVEHYERFIQGYSVKIADTHGIGYIPQPILDFMCAARV